MPKTAPFDRYYQEYESWFEKYRYTYLSELEALKLFVPREGDGLEVGIGSGKFALPLNIMTGVDPSKKMRELAEKKGLAVYDGVGEALPFKDGSFDFVLMVTTVCFLDDVSEAFYEVKRVLKKEGRFIVGFIDKESSLGRVYEAKKQENVFYRDAVFHSAGEIISLLNSAGFTDVQAVQTIFGDLREIDSVQESREGYGEGGFVVVCARRNG